MTPNFLRLPLFVLTYSLKTGPILRSDFGQLYSFIPNRELTLNNPDFYTEFMQ